MTDLLKTISESLSIIPYHGEEQGEFCYRVCYSALALSMLFSAKSKEAGKEGISKKAQTELLHRKLLEFEKQLHVDKAKFFQESNSFSAHFRKVYEETGFFLVDERGYEILASFGRTIPSEKDYLYFGIPDSITALRGLGVYTSTSQYDDFLFDAFLRDTLSVDEFIAAVYNPIDFDHRDLDQNGLEFFNPTLKKSPHSSWEPSIRTRRTIARSKELRTMYRVISEGDKNLLFADILPDASKDSLDSGEVRRLYIALKEQYGEPAVAWINKIDENYFEIKLSAQLPSREYFFILLCAWPKQFVFNKTSFIAAKEVLPSIESMLQNIGIKTKRGIKYV